MKLSGLPELIAGRVAEAVLSRNRIRNPALAAFLRGQFEQPVGTGGSFIADPVVEGAFPWKSGAGSLADLRASGFLSPEIVEALGETKPLAPKERDDRNSWPADRAPYLHQLEAWRRLKDDPPRSVVIASGTGSGKTESFLVPILDDLARQAAKGSRLVGVQAILLYPLNALIASQQDRLSDWTAPLDGRVRYCLYNGNTPEQIREAARQETPWEVRDRQQLRASPPPLLVTNATMLEYMLVRGSDAPIIKASRGKLKWIVLDEAHTYVGSQAAELTLLLRRTLQAFGMHPGEVRFVATSATLGDGTGVRDALRRFLADIAGTDLSRVDVIVGERDVPEVKLPDVLDARAGALRKALTVPRGLAELSANFGDDVVTLIDRAATARDTGGRPFLPVRAHLFQRAHGGVWACINPGCHGRQGSALDSPEWPYGRAFEKDIPRCKACGALTLEVRQCVNCGMAALEGTIDGAATRLERRRAEEAIDEFRADAEVGDDEDEDAAASPSERVILGPLTWQGGLPTRIDANTGDIKDRKGEGTIEWSRFPFDECPCCGAQGSKNRDLFRSFRIGGPALLGVAASTLLDSVPSQDRGASGAPHGGRQLITFTDSRQGTARFAAVWQQEAERGFARSNIYHCLLGGSAASEDRVRKVETDLASLMALPAGLRESVRSTIEEKEKELASIRTGSLAVSWEELKRQLSMANADAKGLIEVWGDRESKFEDPAEIARLQLYAEFLRRPLRANSLETMGLASLRFQPIEDLHDADVPRPFSGRGGSLKDWRDYLYLLLTHFIRENSVVGIDEGLRRWVGQRVYPRSAHEPGFEGDIPRWERRWPGLRGSGARYSRPILWLRDGLGLDPDRAADRDDINEILQAAYRPVNRLRMIGGDLFRLDLQKASIAAPRDVWLCPVTQRLLDRTFRGLTPYLSIVRDEARLRAIPLSMPRLPWPGGRKAEDGREASEEIAEWLATNSGVVELRRRGVWTDLHDRIMRRSPYIRIAEHSAQQPPARLRDFERRFKRRTINVLACSTTMEMGVDIGGLAAVGMTNVPPSPANYRQRVGRAGRRSDALAIAHTYCPDTPLGWHVFDRPTWLLQANIRPPRVALNSETIVQRHVNAYLLSRFLQNDSPVEVTGLKTGWFFGLVGQETAPCDRFKLWLDREALNHVEIRTGLAAIAAGTVLGGRESLVGDCGNATAVVVDSWRTQRNALNEDINASEGTPARTALQLQLKRFEGEFLLGELASRGLLPGYGFPTDVVPFVVVSQTRRARSADELGDLGADAGRVDPTRTLDVAVREYAPGAHVVLNGIVYRSAGITLNWKRPATDAGAREIQSITRFWKCTVCGLAGESHGEPDLCPACGSTDLRTNEVLKPAGFAVDIEDEPNNDVERVDYVPGQAPLISASGATWIPLDDPELGRFRASPSGLIMARNSGAHGHGYAVCLACGRAAPETVGRSGATVSSIPDAMKDHRPLRRGSRSTKARCVGQGENFKIKRHLALGYSRRSDVFELQLEGISNQAVYAVAIALREGLARQLGIERDEIAWDVASGQDREGKATPTIYLFDQAAGGAGYATQATTDFAGLLDAALETLDCPSKCDSACPACLVVRDTVGHANKLDRHAAIAQLRRVRDALRLPSEVRAFGALADQWMVRLPLDEELDRALERHRMAELCLFLSGAPKEWDLATWWGSRLAERWARAGRRVRIVADAATLKAPSFDDALALRALADRAGPNATVIATPVVSSPPGLLAAVSYDASARLFAAPDGAGANPKTQPPAVVVHARVDGWAAPSGNPFDAAPFIVQRPGGGRTSRIEIGTGLDGPFSSFGQKLWRQIENGAPDFVAKLRREAITSIEYSDRYLFAPLPLRLLLETLRYLPGRPTDRRLPVTVRTQVERSAGDFRGDGIALQHNWRDLRARDAVIVSALQTVGAQAKIVTVPREDIDHARILNIKYQDGRTELILDQGFGFWRTAATVRFDFTANYGRQTMNLTTARGTIVAPSGRTTVLFATPIDE